MNITKIIFALTVFAVSISAQSSYLLPEDVDMSFSRIYKNQTYAPHESPATSTDTYTLIHVCKQELSMNEYGEWEKPVIAKEFVKVVTEIKFSSRKAEKLYNKNLKTATGEALKNLKERATLVAQYGAIDYASIVEIIQHLNS